MLKKLNAIRRNIIGIVRAGDIAVVERFGRFHRVLRPGPLLSPLLLE